MDLSLDFDKNQQQINESCQSTALYTKGDVKINSRSPGK